MILFNNITGVDFLKTVLILRRYIQGQEQNQLKANIGDLFFFICTRICIIIVNSFPRDLGHILKPQTYTSVRPI